MIRFRERDKYSKGERTEEIAETNGSLATNEFHPHLAVPKPFKAKGEKNYEKVKSIEGKGVAPVKSIKL